MRILIFLVFSSFISLGQESNKIAYQYYINGEYKKAIAIYESLSKEDAHINSYYRGYYSCLLKVEDFKKAEDLAVKIYRLYPNSLDFQLEIGIAQEKSGKIKKSEYTYNKVFQKLEEKHNQTINLANTFIRHEMYQNALDLYLLSEKINPNNNFGMQKARLFAQNGEVELMLKEYLNEMERNPTQKQMVTSQIQKFLDNDGIKSDKNYKLVKRLLLLKVRGEKERTDFTEMLIWLFMQNHQFKMALIQAKALDKRTNSNGQGVYDLAEIFLDKEHFALSEEAYDYVIGKGKKHPFFIKANINKIYALTRSISIKNE